MAFARFIGGALGWALGGPIGALLGFAVGAMADGGALGKRAEGDQQRLQGGRPQTRPGDFSGALLVLSAAVMKADSKLLKSELDFIRDFYKRQFGENTAVQQMGVLKTLLQKEIPVRQVCEQIRHNMEHAMRLQLMYYLFGIAKSDGDVAKSEVDEITRIAGYLGISQADYESIRAMFYKDTVSAYKILEIEKSATDEEVKKAYRKMAVKYHPDKVRELGDAHRKAAEEKFLKVKDAYEGIKKERGMK
ncbi:MAG: TerB family tellurite resistance protein [Flavobacteriales bacterium]